MTYTPTLQDKLYGLKRRVFSKLAVAWYWKYRLNIYREKYPKFYSVVKTFEATSSLDDLTGWRSGNGGVLWLGHDKAISILGDGNYSFRYLFRRFGYQIYGSDPYKDLTQFCINTPLPEIKLLVYVGGTSVSFGRVVSPSFYSAMEAEQAMFKSRLPVKYSYTDIALQALYVTVADLLKPVQCRDVYLSINGEVELECDEDEDEEPVTAESSITAGCGIGMVAIALSKEPENWGDLLEAIEKKGGGDFLEGVRVVLRILEDN